MQLKIDTTRLALVIGMVAVIIADMIMQPTDGIQTLVTAVIGATIGFLSHDQGVNVGSNVAATTQQQTAQVTKEAQASVTESTQHTTSETST